MRENFWHFHRHLAGMRALPRLTVHAQLHREIMWIGNFISSYNPGPQWAECIDSLAEAEHSRLHLPPLNVACGNVIENHVPADVILCLFRAEVLAAFLQHDCQLQLVVKFLSQMLGVDYRLVLANDGIDVLEENNPGHHRMGKACFGRFLVVLAEIARGVKKLSRNDRRCQSDFVGSIKNCLATGPGRTTVLLQHVIEGLMCSFQASVAALKQGPDRKSTRLNSS